MSVGVMKDYKLKLGSYTPRGYTGLTVELQHLKIETRLTIDKFASAMGEYVTESCDIFFIYLLFFIYYLL